MLFKQFIFLAVTALAAISFAKPLPKGHADVVARSAAAPQVAKRGVLGLPIGIPTPVPNTIPAILVNLNSNLGSLLTGNLNGTIPSGDGDVASLATDIETIKELIDNAQSLLSGATGGASSPVETIGALTNVVKTVVALLTNISSASKGLTSRQLPTDGLPIVGGLLETLLQTVTNLLSSILGGLGGIGGIGGGLGGIGGGLGGIGGLGANGRKANDVSKALADSVATAASLFSGLGVDATSLTKAVGA